MVLRRRADGRRILVGSTCARDSVPVLITGGQTKLADAMRATLAETEQRTQRLTARENLIAIQADFDRLASASSASGVNTVRLPRRPRGTTPSAVATERAHLARAFAAANVQMAMEIPGGEVIVPADLRLRSETAEAAATMGLVQRDQETLWRSGDQSAATGLTAGETRAGRADRHARASSALADLATCCRDSQASAVIPGALPAAPSDTVAA